jgi:general secretion pathway protein F
MALFSYKGMNPQGKDVKGEVNAENLSSAKQKVKQMGVMLLEIKEQKSDLKKSSTSTVSFGGNISITDLSLMTRQLATLLRAKIPIVESLKALIDQSENPKLRIILSEVRQKVNEGSSLSKAFGEYPKTFDSIYINMIDAGESSGTLEIVLLRLAEFTEAQMKLRSKIKGALTYPIIMIAVAVLMMALIFIFVIPKITKIFITMKKELPLQTKVCIWISAFLKSYWWLVIIGTFVGYYFFKRYINSKKGRPVWDAFLLKSPIIGELVMMINVGRFCSTLATLLNSSVPILASLRIVENLLSNVHMKAAVSESKEFVSKGMSMTTPLVKSGHFPPMVTHMIQLGEKSGEVETMLNIVAENYNDEVEAKLSGLTSILEPIMIVGMGISVAFIIFSVVVPMMELNTLK